METARQPRQRLEWCSYKPRNFKAGQSPPEARKRPGGVLPAGFRWNTDLPTPGFHTVASRTVRGHTSVVLDLLVCGTLLAVLGTEDHPTWS